jgi:hypothetical protein
MVPSTQCSENPTSHSKHASESSISPEAILDISIAMWDAGWADIKAMIDEDPKVVERDAFPKVFHLKYVKSSVCKYKKLWGNTPEPLKKKFITLGNTSNGSWCKFWEALRDPTMVGPLICDNSTTIGRLIYTCPIFSFRFSSTSDFHPPSGSFSSDLSSADQPCQCTQYLFHPSC